MHTLFAIFHQRYSIEDCFLTTFFFHSLPTSNTYDIVNFLPRMSSELPCETLKSVYLHIYPIWSIAFYL